jgi:DNA polymerase I-like protein with 3'-5' exonuclease and polymerase domains
MHVSTDPAFWDSLNVKFFTKYKGIDDCHNKWKDEVILGKPIQGPLGRAWTINMKDGFKIPWTTLSNYPVQGTGADVMMFARISAYKRIKASRIDCKFISTVHDSIVVMCHPKDVQAIVNIFHQVFDDIPKNIRNVFGYDWNVPMDCECKMGWNMKDMEKVKRNT